MNKVKIIALAAAVSLTITALPMLVSGEETAFDSQNDPLITLSYIEKVISPKYDEKISELTKKNKELTEKLDAFEEAVDKANKTILALEEKLSAITTPGSSSALGQYEVVHMNKGAKLIAKSPCELILRSGSGIVVSITSNGINDFSEGTELMNAEEIPLYHGLLVPRGNDGRGIQITSSEAYVMVRGEYEIVE